MEKLLFCYGCSINLLAILITIFDKQRAKKGKWRVAEKTLLWVASLGGSLAMFFTMLIIRHKTKHKKFMVGIPIIIFLQAIIIFLFFHYFIL